MMIYPRKKTCHIFQFFSIFILLAFILTSCVDSMKFDRKFCMEEFLSDSILVDGCRNPIFLRIYNSTLTVVDEDVNQFVKRYNFFGKKIDGFIKLGKGPGEFISPICFQFDTDGKLWFSEDPNWIMCLPLNEVLSMSNLPISARKAMDYDPSIGAFSNPIILNDSTVILSSTKDSSLFTTLTLGGSASSGVVDPLYNAGYNRILNQPYLRNQFYYKYLAYNDTLQRMFCAYLRHNKVAMAYLSQGRTEVRAVAQGDDDPPTVVAQNVISQFFAYESAIPYGKYIYCSYLGKPFFTQDYSVVHPSEVHVFDWDLNPVAKLIFESPVADFALADGKMYVISTRERPQILVYQLPI